MLIAAVDQKREAPGLQRKKAVRRTTHSPCYWPHPRSFQRILGHEQMFFAESLSHEKPAEVESEEEVLRLPLSHGDPSCLVVLVHGQSGDCIDEDGVELASWNLGVVFSSAKTPRRWQQNVVRKEQGLTRPLSWTRFLLQLMSYNPNQTPLSYSLFWTNPDFLFD